MPFDWKNPCGFTMAAILEQTFLTYVCMLAADLFTMGFAGFLIEMAMIRDTKIVLKSFNECATIKSSHTKTLKLLASFLRIHSKANQ